MFCEICAQLHLEDYTGIKKTLIKDIRSDWIKQSNCKAPDQIEWN